jgi:outer membrane autotransporter protein
VNEQTKALSEGFLGGTALVNLGGEVVAGQGMDSAVKSARAGLAGGYGVATFGAVSGGHSRYNTGSHVDVSSLSLMTGFSWGAELKPGNLTLGAFFEYGNGSYETHNSFSNAASVKGDGDMYYLGGGILGRMDFINTGPGHFQAEAAARAGSLHNEYSSGDLRDFTGRKADYDSSSAYYGLHLGAGYLWEINDRASLDLYGKYFWTHQAGDRVRLSTGDPVSFKEVDSHRTRAGARFAYEANDYVSPYIGAAWEYEFDGEAKATTNGYAIKAPDLTGSTGLGELGLTLKPSKDLPLSFDLGVHGYVGKREGVTGTLQAKWEF